LQDARKLQDVEDRARSMGQAHARGIEVSVIRCVPLETDRRGSATFVELTVANRSAAAISQVSATLLDTGVDVAIRSVQTERLDPRESLRLEVLLEQHVQDSQVLGDVVFRDFWDQWWSRRCGQDPALCIPASDAPDR
jgi:hypothetical protein